MKKIITYHQGFLLALVVLVSSCVNDDSLFPDDNGDDITQSPALVTVLNNFDSMGDVTISETDLCFRFVYPVVLGYNTDSSIKIDNYDGLTSVISGQSINFNISGLQFPVQIVFNGNSDTRLTIDNEESLINILRECNFNTLRQDFDRLFRQCFKFDYPVTLVNRDGGEVLLSSKEEFDSFYSSQGADYQPLFKLPVSILVGPNFSSKEVNTYFEFYQIINDCVGCPNNAEFTKELIESPATYRFTSSIELSDAVFFWFINNELVGDARMNVFEYDFLAVFDGSVPGGPGSYEVCLKVVTPDCPEGIKTCKEIVVEPICPDLRFEFAQAAGTFSYDFEANFPGINEVTYNWIVDDQVIEDNDGGVNGDNRFTFQFTPGIHNVCIRTETPSCPAGTDFCEEIIVCPELFFMSEQQGGTNTYDFFAEFPGMDMITYQWTINGEPQESDGGAGGDNRFTFQFDPATSYEICIVTEIEGCTDGTRFCVTLDIP